MKKLFLILFISVMTMAPIQKTYALDAKGKAFLVICTYGTVGGALLGFASMAFGTNSRAIAQGASLGLYAGIAFGSYVLLSHKSNNQVPADFDAPPPGVEPLPGDAPPEGGGFGSPSSFGSPSGDGSGFFGGGGRIEQVEDNLYNFRYKKKTYTMYFF